MAILKVTLRWVARAIGALLVGLALVIAMGEGIDPGQLDEFLKPQTFWFLTSLTGMVLLWRWEAIGGLLVVLGMVGFFALEFLWSGRPPGGWVLPTCFVPGILVLVSWAIPNRSLKPD